MYVSYFTSVQSSCIFIALGTIVNQRCRRDRFWCNGQELLRVKVWRVITSALRLGAAQYDALLHARLERKHSTSISFTLRCSAPETSLPRIDKKASCNCARQVAQRCCLAHRVHGTCTVSFSSNYSLFLSCSIFSAVIKLEHVQISSFIRLSTPAQKSACVAMNISRETM